MKNKTEGLTYAEQAARRLRIAAYPDEHLLRALDEWCVNNNMDRNAAMRYIMRVMLNVEDNEPDTTLKTCISMLEEQINRLRQAEAIC